MIEMFIEIRLTHNKNQNFFELFVYCWWLLFVYCWWFFTLFSCLVLVGLKHVGLKHVAGSVFAWQELFSLQNSAGFGILLAAGGATLLSFCHLFISVYVFFPLMRFLTATY
jgi:hypothetical protein